MKKKVDNNIEYTLVDPGGNITALVNKKFSPQKRIQVADTIMKKNPKIIEQVGFFYGEKIVTLDMAGGEFCGNATRSLAYLCCVKGFGKKIYIKSEHFKSPLVGIVSGKKTSLVIPLGEIKLTKIESNIYIVELPGIAHIVEYGIKSKGKLSSKFSHPLMKGYLALGYIFISKKQNNYFKIEPTVLVKKTKKIFEETACASGSIATALVLQDLHGLINSIIKQPSGSLYEVCISNKKNTIKISGPASIL